MTQSEAELRDLVHRYHVTWETRPELASSGGAVAPVGFLVELKATPERSEGTLSSNGPEWHKVEAALERIALALAAPHEVDLPRGRLQLGPDQHPRMSAIVTVLHQDGAASAPPDAAQRQHLGQIVDRLRALGAREGDP